MSPSSKNNQIKINQFLQQAQQHYQTAEHLLLITHPQLKDPKLYLAIINQLLSALDSAFEALIISSTTTIIKVPNFKVSIQKFNYLLENKLLQNKISSSTLKQIHSLLNIPAQQQQSPIEFRRQEAYIICSPDYQQLQQLSPQLIQEYLHQTKLFLQQIKEIIIN